MELSAQVQQYIRVAIYWFCGSLATHGVSAAGSYKELAASAAISLATLGWTVWKTRPQAKINDVANMGVVDKIVVNDAATAAAAPANVKTK